ncbi:MAG: HEAT repeat domain-containing protein [Candidatus Thorarchaeota archaeon]|nr:HEAT repeat domain-containing protein [Candidatus Thorarchaeota archaeon]
MSWENFLEAVHTADFEKSTRILSESTNAGTLNLFTEHIQDEIEVQNHSPLPFRDHVLYFLDIFPIYHSVNITSYDLLRKYLDYRDPQEVKDDVLDWAVSLIENDSPSFIPYVLEIEDLADSIFVTTIPDILSRRVKELSGIRIPSSIVISGDRLRTRYFIKSLWSTAYGRQLLLVMGKDIQSNVIGSSSWMEIKEALHDLGYQGDSMLDGMSEVEWYELTYREGRSPFRGTSSSSSELLALTLCQNANLELGSPQLKTRVKALETIQSLGTNSCNRKIMNLAQDGTSSEQVRAIGIIATTGGHDEEEFLSALMNECSSDIRTHVAKGLSQMVSRGFAHSVVRSRRGEESTKPKRRGEYSTVDSLEKLDTVLRSANRNARIDAARALALMNTSEAEQLLYKLARDADPRVRLEVVELTPSLSRDFAVVIMQHALEDKSTAVRSSAIQIGKRFWPEQDWPEL